MANDRRSADRKEIDAMTREFLSRGGTIVQCAPGPSDNVVTKGNSFRRRRPAGDGRPTGPAAAPAAPVTATTTAPGRGTDPAADPAE